MPDFPQSDSLNEWLSYIEKQHPVEIELGLDRIQVVAKRLALPKIARQIIIVAGTNGKGSCVRTFESLALASGKKVGSYTSPHLLKYNERIKVQGVPVDDTSICKAFARIEAARGSVSLTYFEMGTLAALLILAQQDLDLAVLEVGLGGRFDAVNIMDADVAVITPIDIDHSAWLGNDRATIALEKAGITRPGKPVVCADPCPPDSLRAYLSEQHCQRFFLGNDFGERNNGDGTLVYFTVGSNGQKREEQIGISGLPLTSVLAAVQAWLILGFEIDQSWFRNGIAQLELPGRYQIKEIQGRRVILDVAHNPAAAQFLARRLRKETSPVACVMAIMSDKDVVEVVKSLEHVIERWFVGDLTANPRSLAAEELEKLLYARHQQVNRLKTVMDAFNSALQVTPRGGSVLVCGSFFTVAEVLAKLESTDEN